jgi:hypothetical protein
VHGTLAGSPSLSGRWNRKRSVISAVDSDTARRSALVQRRRTSASSARVNLAAWSPSGWPRTPKSCASCVSTCVVILDCGRFPPLHFESAPSPCRAPQPTRPSATCAQARRSGLQHSQEGRTKPPDYRTSSPRSSLALRAGAEQASSRSLWPQRTEGDIIPLFDHFYYQIVL